LRKRLLLLPCLLILSAFALAACGSSGGEEGEVEEAIKTSAESTDPADCSKLSTQQFMEQTTGESGEAAVKKCEEEAKEDEGVESVGVTSVEVDGSSATAEAALTGGSLDGQTVEVEVVKDGDQWKMNKVVKFTKIDRAKLVKVLESGFSKQSSEVDPRLADCFIEAFKQGPQAEVEGLVLEDSAPGLEEAAEACASSPST
jgi:hypothetical protein